MTLIRENEAAMSVHVPVTHRARMTVEREMALQQHRGTRINDLPSLYPFGALRERLLFAAKKWVADMEKQDFDLLSAEADVKVFGPYRSRAGTFGDVKQRKRTTALGDVGQVSTPVTAYSEDEEFNPAAADYVLEADFLARRHRPLQTKESA